jgi:hypothetical protein
LSIRWLSHVWLRSPYKSERLLLHLALADFANDEGLCWPSQRTLAQKARCSENFVRVTIAQMVKDGVLEVAKQGRGRGNTTAYILKTHLANGDSPNPHSPRRENPIREETTPLVNRHEPSTTDAWFVQFWSAYPRKTAKKEARAVFGKLMARKDAPTLEAILDSVAKYASTLSDMRYCCYPARFLRQERWLDGGAEASAKVEVEQRIRDAESTGAAYAHAGYSEGDLVASFAERPDDERAAALSLYRHIKANRKEQR